MGGKWTSYRAMGKDTVKEILKHNKELVASEPLKTPTKYIGSYTRLGVKENMQFAFASTLK